ncbi:N-acetylmuramoyl-L-alanine amidase family protein [Sporosarcina soli]|uniref:N-acetylmuramoyl-L-alanine amidase n=1 Tax=Sporosarcina soli TaxID=334736 RepID=A0ABW0TG82_9BACL
MAYVIINKFIPATLYPLKAPYAMVPEYVTIHNTYNDATALNEIAYMTRNTAPVSYHVAIDDKYAVQAIPFTRNTFHAGDGPVGNGNRKSIGIEICYSKSGGPKYVAAEANTVEYVSHLLKRYGWGIDRVKWHQDWSGKKCPHRIIDEGRLQSVKDRIAKRLAELKNPKLVSMDEPQKEDDELKFSSPSLKAETEFTLQSKARREIIVNAAIASGAQPFWKERLNNGTITDGDILALAAKYTVAVNK